MKNENTSQKFWKYFWGTIIFLFIIYISIIVSISLQNNKQSKQRSISKDVNGSITLSSSFLKTLEKQLPLINNDINNEINETQHKIYLHIDREVNALFTSVYHQIPQYADFHYSLTGEYLEIGSALSGNLATSIKEKLFDTVNFDSNYQNILNNIQINSQSLISATVVSINEKSQDKLHLLDNEMKIFNNVSNLTMDDSMARFNDITYNIIKVGALGTGAKFSTVMIAKVMAKKIATKVLTKAAVKGGAKVIGIGGGAAAGATVGSVVPGVGTVIGGVIGGIAAWLVVDKVIIEMDEVLNREEFEEELKVLITKQKKNMKMEIKNTYFKSLKFFSNELQENYQRLRLKEIINRK
jgi:hypothetical protein